MHTCDGDRALGRHGLGGGAERGGCKRHAGVGVERKLVPLAHGDQVERETCSLRLGEHARTFQEDEAWLAPDGETSETADDLVVRA